MSDCISSRKTVSFNQQNQLKDNRAISTDVSLVSLLLILDKYQDHNQEFLRTAEVSWNKCISINISFAALERMPPQGKIWQFFLLDTLKTAF